MGVALGRGPARLAHRVLGDGRGRCSASPFELHGGGSDLVFPHHENEIAQTEAARGKPLSRAWMHNGMVQMGEEKMAKSVGNIRLLHGALDEFGRDAFVMWMVGAHYRKPVAYSEEALEDAGARRCARARPRPPAGSRGTAPGSSTARRRIFRRPE